MLPRTRKRMAGGGRFQGRQEVSSAHVQAAVTIRCPMERVAGDSNTQSGEEANQIQGLFSEVSHRTDLVMAFQRKLYKRKVTGFLGAECWICHCPILTKNYCRVSA